LRTSLDSDNDLKSSFSQIPMELGNPAGVSFRIVVQGENLPVRAVIHDEVYRIGREALVNAFRHARASNIDVLLEYDANHLRLLVSDDGCGIDSHVLQSGRDGHWGLSGMRARSERIGAKFRVRSRPQAGTEVELSIPKSIAYVPQPSSGVSKWISWLVPRWKSMSPHFPSEHRR
jgi:signal transduction histidine kinase